MVGFVGAKLSIFKGAKKARLNMGNKRSLFYLHKARFYLKSAPHQNRRFNRKNKRSLFLSTLTCFTHEACFYLKPAPYQNRRFHHKNKRSLLYPPKLVLSAKACFYPKSDPHNKRPYTKGLFLHPSRIAASIAKTSKACFIYQSLFLSTTLTPPIQSL